MHLRVFKQKYRIVFAFGVGFFLASLSGLLLTGTHVVAASDTYTLEGAIKLNNGSYSSGTLYITNDALKSGLPQNYLASGLPLTYQSDSASAAAGLTGSNASWEGSFTSPGSNTNGYWCAQPKDPHSPGTINIVMWQNGPGGQWNLTAFCNGSTGTAANTLTEPASVPWGTSGGTSLSIAHPSVKIKGVQTPPAGGNPKLPDVSATEEYNFTDGQGKTIQACKGVYEQFPGGCLNFTYDPAISATQSQGATVSDIGLPTTAVWTALGTANGVCSIRLHISLALDSVDSGNVLYTGATLGGGDYSGADSYPRNLNTTAGTAASYTPCQDNKTFEYKFLPAINTQSDKGRWTSFTTSITDSLSPSVINDFLAAGYYGLELGSADDCSSNEACASTGCSITWYNPLTWIACPIVGMLEEAIKGMDNFITSALTINVDTVFDTSGGYYKAWSSFRILSTAVIIIAGIIMVASQALGFEFLDAYTIRKVLPRLLIAIIGISLSWPLMKFFVGFFNIVGYDIRNLIYSPFSSLHIDTLNAGTLLAINGALIGSILLMGMGATLSLLATAGLAILIGFLIIIIRDMAIIVLVILAPIAIACYILPNTQKVWKLWSDNFMGLLVMFPIISAFIAIGKVFSAVSLNPSSGAVSSAWGSGTVMQIVGFIAYFLPYFLLPVSFRLATGVIGSIAGFVNDRNRGVFDRLKKYRGNAIERRTGYYKNRIGDRVMQGRAQAVRSLNERSSSSGRVRGGLMRFAGRRIAGLGGIEEKMSAINARASKKANDQIATGMDADYRGSTVNLEQIKAMGGFELARAISDAAAAAGDFKNQVVRLENGKRQYKSLGGAWIDEADVIEGHKRHGRDAGAQQAALSYEMRKASSEDEIQGIMQRYGALATQQWHMTDTQAGGAWIGAAFENQNQHLEFKSTDWKTGRLSGSNKGTNTTGQVVEDSGLRAEKLVNEIYEKRGSYNVAQMSSNTVEQLKESYKAADLTLAGLDHSGNAVNFTAAQINAARDQKEKIEAIAQTFMHDFGAGGFAADDQGQAQPGGSRRSASTPGAAHTAERVAELARMTGVYGTAPTGNYTAPQDRNAPHPREQD